MKKLPQITRVSDIRVGQDVYFDAWLYNMMMDNNVAYQMNPAIIAGPEQMRFMVVTEPDQVYLPCSDKTFAMLMQPCCPGRLRNAYNRAWRIIVRLIRSVVSDRATRQRILGFCRYRFQVVMDQHTMIPSRVVKRLTNMVFAQSGQEDPWEGRRRDANRRALALLRAPEMQRILNATPPEGLHGDIATIRWELNHLELARLMYLSMMSRPWLESPPSALDLQDEFEQALHASEVLRALFGPESDQSKTILFLCDADGGTIFDLAMLHRLMRMGHKIILALKDGFYFYAPTINDVEADPVFKDSVEQGIVVHDPAVTKNELLRLLREYRMVVISDGTRERLNLYRTSVTFARAWKEADLILAKGWRNADMLLGSSQSFTRDILCYWLDQDGAYQLRTKSHARGVRKFSETSLTARADAIIEEMRQARREGKSVMFYSCIIGSIPGQTTTATKIVRAFVENLRHRLDDTFIVNPTEHFEDGMDGDDLMFMWERVQRSGYIDVWRFQTVQDIETSFALLGRKIPPIWAGKDATYSTGCTKEMRIALDMQSKNREMQIIGPAAEKFFRRGEYGVGKYFDARIAV